MDEQKALELLNQNYPIQFSKAEFLRDGGCISYCAVSGGEKYLFKIVKTAFLETAKQSADIMNYLLVHGFPVPRIIPTINGKPYELSAGTMFILFEFIEGREPDLGEKLEEIGEFTGWLHCVMKDYTGSLAVREKPFFMDRYLNLLCQKKYPERKLAEFIDYGDQLWKRIKDLPRGYCHGDLHRGNLLLTSSDQLCFLDFDTSCIAFPAFDIMVMCDATDYFTFKPEGYDTAEQIYERFLEGYTKYRTLTTAEQTAFYDFIALRHYQLQATIIEIYGLDCVDEAFVDRQLDWLRKWRELCKKKGNHREVL